VKLSIITINYNSSKETIELLKSLSNQADKNFKIIVVDNASEEADFNRLQEFVHTTSFNDGGIQLVKNNENLGFSGGNNVGIHQALQNGSEWVILLNNDTWAEKDFVERLGAVLRGKDGVVGIPLVEENHKSPQYQSEARYGAQQITNHKQIVYCGQVQWLKPTLKHVYSIKNQVLRKRKNKNQILNTKYLILNTRFYAIGGAMAVHKDVFDKIGLLDEKYFLYFEDADFSVRARKVGFDTSIASPPTGGLNVHHHVSSSAKKLGSPMLLRYHYRNALYFNLKNGPWYIKLLVWPWSWIIVIKQFIKVAIKQNVEQSKAILNGVRDFYKNKFGRVVDF